MARWGPAAGAVSDRQLERERRAAGGGRADAKRAAVGLGDRARDEETEARPGLRAAGDVGAAELLEDQTLVLRWDAGPVVGHLDPDRAVVRSRADDDLVAGGRVLDRVLDQV